MMTNGKASYMGRVICALALALVAGFAFTTLAPMAAHADYTYTVRIWAGNEGTVNGNAEYAEVTGLTYGQEITLSKSFDAKVNDNSKYYVKGFRVSGEDALHDGAFDVTEDMEFVVAYGVKGEQVSYTLSFVEYGTGRALRNDEGVTSKTFYGNKGDKPVVAFEYVPGYRPRYRNITGTLGEEGTNNWTCEYIALATGTTTGGTTTGGTTTGGAAGGGTAGGAAAGGTAGGAAAGGAAAGGEAGGAAGTTTPPATEQVLDVDNPLASGASADKSGESADKSGGSADKTGDGKKDDSTENAGFPIAAIYGIAAALVAAVAVGLYLIKRRRDGQINDTPSKE